MNIEIRSAVLNDAASICPLINNELGYGNVKCDELAARLKRMADLKIYHTFVAICDGIIVGFIGAVEETAYEFDGNYFRIIGLAVSKSHQNMGIGKMLIQHLEEFALSKRITKFTLSSGLNRTNAHQFYEHNGYIKKSYSFKKMLS